MKVLNRLLAIGVIVFVIIVLTMPKGELIAPRAPGLDNTHLELCLSENHI